MAEVAEEVATAEFDRFADLMDLDLDPKFMTSEDREGLEKHKRILVEAIKAGRLVVQESGEPVFTPATQPDDPPIIFHEPTGGTFLAMDKRKSGQNVAKVNAMLAEMTQQNPSRFSRMKHRDYKVCQAVILIFLG